jgi:3-hydroxyacyl-CoA dehydrogenase
MGRSIALANLERGLPVVLTDISPEALDRAADLLRQEASPDRQALLTFASSLTDLAGCDLVLEAVVETLKVKRQVFARLEPLVSEDALFASNTSCIPIGQIACGLATPGRLCGLHFCHPVRCRPLVEVIRAPATTDAVIATAYAYVRTLGMEGVLVKDAPGFVVNRLLHPYLNEALTLLDEGAGIEEVDAAAVAIGMPWGPLTQMDEIGIDVVLRGGQIMAQAYPEYAAPADLLVALFGLGRLGRKTGAGFYRYGARNKPFVDAEMQALLSQRGRPRHFSRDAVSRRLFNRMATECQRIVAEGVVGGFPDLARTLVGGLGFDADKVAAFRK